MSCWDERTLRAPCPRLAAGIVMLCLGLLLGGCTSAEEKCEQARAAAGAAWDTYLQTLQAQAEAETKIVADSKLALEGKIDKRLSFKAKQEATRQHDEGTTAWHRTYTAHYQAACTQDEECNAVRMKKREAETALESIEPTLKTTQAVREAISGPPEALVAAAAAVEEDFERPSYKPAMAAAEAVREACAGL